jgi:CelD/BcsL family acetyltransferase involved in cellulose biosynthesis
VYAGNYLATRSANTRQQLRRSLRALEKHFGKTRLTAASCTTEALKWFKEIAPLHRARWPRDGKPTQFDNPKFVAFHETLINSSFDSGSIDLLRLESGGVAIAYLYNLKSGGHVSFYLSGIDYALARKFHPGMLAHWLAIERYLSNGGSAYDFLMEVAIKPENYLMLVQQLSLQAEAVHAMLEKFGTAKQPDVH